MRTMDKFLLENALVELILTGTRWVSHHLHSPTKSAQFLSTFSQSAQLLHTIVMCESAWHEC